MGGSEGGDGNAHINPLLRELQVGLLRAGALSPADPACTDVLRLQEPPALRPAVVPLFSFMADYHVFTRWATAARRGGGFPGKGSSDRRFTSKWKSQ